jgi:dTDP-4-amino-4,6-dideoxygalactose transaminase
LGTEELNFVHQAFDTNWIAPLGPNVNGFEADLQAYNKVAHAAALSSGTAAIHIALRLLDVQPGDYVLCQSFTFCGSANPILYMGAKPVFIDSEPDTWNMSPAHLREAIEDLYSQGIRPKACIPVHLYGTPAKMKEIVNICDNFSIPIIEDAAESLGATLHGQHTEVGYNYRLSNVLAGIGRGQMQVLDERIAQRRANFQRYQDYFATWQDHGYHIQFPSEPEGTFCNRWLTTILVDPKQNKGLTREDLRLALEKDNIEARPLWKPMHLQPVFQETPFYGDGTSERLFEMGLCLPSGTNMSEADWDRIFKVLDQIIAER